jgi:hypothetical protein
MLLALALALQTSVNLPEHPGFDYSGLPVIQSGGLHAQTHGATVATTDVYADFSSTTVYKNPGGAGMATVMIPRRRIGDSASGNPTFAIHATWDNKPIALMTHGTRGGEPMGGSVLYESDFTGKVPLVKGGTHVLRINYRVNTGKCGFDRKQHMVGYWLDGSDPIDGLNLAYPYGGRTVFRLPEVFPTDFEWEIGTRGAFVRKQNFTPGGQLTYITFYYGGFKPIGDPGQ